MQDFTSLEKKAEKAESCDAFSGLKLLHIKKKVQEILELIGRYEIFDQYTKHNISHIDQLLKICDWIIPEETKERLTPADSLMIVLSIYFHDLGMLVTKDEYAKRGQSGFIDYKNKILSGDLSLDYKAKIEEKYNLDENEAEHFLYQEFVRHKHAERIKYWIQGKQKDELGLSDKIVGEINKLLDALPSKFRLDLGLVCESHHLPDLDDFKKYSVSFPYGKSSEETANMHYAAIILRTVDLIHITSDRTPTTEFVLINPSDPVSQIEWIKQMAVTNVRAKVKKSKEGKIDQSLQKDTIEVTAFFDSPDKSEAFFSLISYLNYCRKELKQSYTWAEIAVKEHGSEYSFPWKDINDDNVITQGFERELFQFNLDQNKILNLLVGHTLYNDSTVVLRELIQNSIDAIRLYRHQNHKIDDEEIQIIWDSKKRNLEIIDTGTGMDRFIIEEHLLKVGSSRYQDEKFIKNNPDFSPISRFGIGVLTCFLVSNEIEITTVMDGAESALNLTIKDVDGKYLLRNIPKSPLLNPIKTHGTKILLKIRHDIDMTDLILNIKKWILFPNCKVSVRIDNDDWVQIGYSTLKESLEIFLVEIGYNLDEDEIKVVESEIGGISIAYALKYLKYFKEWHFLRLNSNRTYLSEYNPIGTAVEGVRVEFDTPGFIGQRLVAVVNAQGKNAPKTNVARSIIEDTGQKNFLLESVYNLYVDHVKGEIDKLSNLEGFSVTWASQEVLGLLGPLLRNYSDEDKSEIKDQALLNKAINTIKAILIESADRRMSVSSEEINLQKEVLTIDCELYRSVEDMLREIRNQSSLKKILEVLYGTEHVDLDSSKYILCGFDPENVLHENALLNKEISAFKLHHDKRRVDVVWGNSGSSPKWFDPYKGHNIYTSRRRRHYGGGDTFIQLSDVAIDGIKDEIAISAFRRLYILKGSPYHEYLVKLMSKLDLSNNSDQFSIFSLILTLGSRLLSSNKSYVTERELEESLEYRFESGRGGGRGREMAFFYSFIKRDEIMDAFLKTNWKSFDIDAWNTKGEYDY